MNLIQYIWNKKEILEDLEAANKIDRDYDILRTKYAKKKTEIEELQHEIEYLEERQTKNLKTIRELRKKIKLLEKGD